MRRILFLSLFALALNASGQSGSNWLGIRGGYTSGLEFRHFFNPSNSGRLLLGLRERGLLLHGLYEIHNKELFPSNDQITFIYGAGIHAGFQTWNETEKRGTFYFTEPVTGFAAGIDGLLALEFDLGFVPLTAGIEVKPFLEFGGSHKIHAIPWDFAFTLKLPL